MAQQLLPHSDGIGLIPVVEILRAVPGVRNLIRKGNLQEIYSLMEIGAKHGMQTMDGALLALVKNGTIGRDDGLKKAVKSENFHNSLKDTR